VIFTYVRQANPESEEETKVEVQLIECSKIDTPKVDKDLRSFNKELAVLLAESIKAEGMHNPIAVRPHPTEPGRFRTVQGRHRLYAKGKILKEQFIEARVFVDMDDTDAEMAMISENLFRKQLTKSQHLISLRKWWDYYKSKHPEKVGSGSAMRAAAKKSKGAEPAEKAALSVDCDAIAEAGPGNFSEMYAAATGKSLATAKRDTRIARSFTRDQLEALVQMQTTQGDQTRIAKIKDVDKRGEVVNLIASGMEVEDAMKEVLEVEQLPALAVRESQEAHEAEAAPESATGGEMTDDQWFQCYCGAKAAFLKDPAKFKADAILFRWTSELRRSFRSKSKKYVESAKKAGVTGPLYGLLNRLISISHPKDWLLCEECKGANEYGGRRCEKCYGAGYYLKTERYL